MNELSKDGIFVDNLGLVAKFEYDNYRGETSQRTVKVNSIRHTSTEYHSKQWILFGWDLDKQAERGFAMKDMTSVEFGHTEEFKGKKNGLCNRRACLHHKYVVFRNQGNGSYYCIACALLINDSNRYCPDTRKFAADGILCKTDEGMLPEDIAEMEG